MLTMSTVTFSYSHGRQFRQRVIPGLFSFSDSGLLEPWPCSLFAAVVTFLSKRNRSKLNTLMSLQCLTAVAPLSISSDQCCLCSHEAVLLLANVEAELEKLC